jgi:hypothetical protein
MYSNLGGDHTGKTNAVKFYGNALTSINFVLQQYYLDGFRLHEADESFNKITTELPALADETIPINVTGHQHDDVAKLPERIIALLHFGRSGTGLLNRLIYGYPEITTLPSVYLSGYFNEGVWDKLSTDNWRDLPARFAKEFAVARASKSIPSRLGEPAIPIGDQEGMTSVGQN